MYSTVIQGTPLIWLSKVVLVEEELEVAAVEVEVEVDVAWKKRCRNVYRNFEPDSEGVLCMSHVLADPSHQAQHPSIQGEELILEEKEELDVA